MRFDYFKDNGIDKNLSNTLKTYSVEYEAQILCYSFTGPRNLFALCNGLKKEKCLHRILLLPYFLKYNHVVKCNRGLHSG